MKILFLDIDGVLNKQEDYLVRYEGQNSILLMNVILVKRLIAILEETGAQVVLSSSWRVFEGGREFVEEMGIKVLDVTDNRGPKRGDEIERWVNAHPEVETYAIVDDDSDMLDHQRPFFVQTEFMYGLTEGLAYRLSYKLGGEIPLAVSR